MTKKQRKRNYFSKEKMNRSRCQLQDSLGIDQSPLANLNSRKIAGCMKSNKVSFKEHVPFLLILVMYFFLPLLTVHIATMMQPTGKHCILKMLLS